MIYWLSTVFVCLMLLLSAWSYVFSEATIVGVRDLGFPDFFRIQLAVLKVLAALIIVLPSAPMVIKDWAYAGVAFFLVTAIVAHFAHGDPLWITIVNLVFLGVLLLSYYVLKFA